jgi:hypothetical protein
MNWKLKPAELLNVWKLNLTVNCLPIWSIPVAGQGKALKVK